MSSRGPPRHKRDRSAPPPPSPDAPIRNEAIPVAPDGMVRLVDMQASWVVPELDEERATNYREAAIEGMAEEQLRTFRTHLGKRKGGRPAGKGRKGKGALSDSDVEDDEGGSGSKRGRGNAGSDADDVDLSVLDALMPPPEGAGAGRDGPGGAGAADRGGPSASLLVRAAQGEAPSEADASVASTGSDGPSTASEAAPLGPPVEPVRLRAEHFATISARVAEGTAHDANVDFAEEPERDGAAAVGEIAVGAGAGGATANVEEAAGPRGPPARPSSSSAQVVHITQAIELAESLSLDLVLVTDSAKPPVVRIADSSKLGYEARLKAKAAARAARERQKLADPKEIRLTLRGDERDNALKLEKAREYLAVGQHVRISVVCKGRDPLPAGRQALLEAVDRLADLGEVGGGGLPAKAQRKRWSALIQPSK